MCLRITMGIQCLSEVFFFVYEFIILLHKRCQLILSAFCIERTELHRFFRLYFQWLEFCRVRIHNVVQAHKIALIFAQLPQCFLLACPIFRDTCGFLKEHTTILRAAVKDVIQSILPDNTHAVMPDSRVRKEPINVLDAAARIVQIDLTVAVPVEAALHDNFVIVNGQLLICIVKDQYDLGNAECAAYSRSGKDDVLGAQPAQHTNILLTENPADGIGNIAFAAPIRSHDGSDSLIELNDNPLGK